MQKHLLLALFAITCTLHINNFATPLSEAILMGNLKKVKTCIYNGEKINHIEEPDGKSPLCHAAKNGNLEIIGYLVVNGAKITKPVVTKAQNHFVKTFLYIIHEFNKSQNKYDIAIKHLRAGNNMFLSLLIGEDIRKILSNNFTLKELHLYKIYYTAKKHPKDVKNIIKELSDLGVHLKASDFFATSFPKLLTLLLEKIAATSKKQNIFANSDIAYKILKQYIQDNPQIKKLKPFVPTNFFGIKKKTPKMPISIQR